MSQRWQASTALGGARHGGSEQVHPVYCRCWRVGQERSSERTRVSARHVALGDPPVVCWTKQNVNHAISHVGVVTGPEPDELRSRATVDPLGRSVRLATLMHNSPLPTLTYCHYVRWSRMGAECRMKYRVFPRATLI